MICYSIQSTSILCAPGIFLPPCLRTRDWDLDYWQVEDIHPATALYYRVDIVVVWSEIFTVQATKCTWLTLLTSSTLTVNYSFFTLKTGVISKEYKTCIHSNIYMLQYTPTHLILRQDTYCTSHIHDGWQSSFKTLSCSPIDTVVIIVVIITSIFLWEVKIIYLSCIQVPDYLSIYLIHLTNPSGQMYPYHKHHS